MNHTQPSSSSLPLSQTIIVNNQKHKNISEEYESLVNSILQSDDDNIDDICIQYDVEQPTEKCTEIHKKKFVCKICNSAFSRPYLLTVHERFHLGIKPYKCEINDCTKSFVTSSDLQRHIRTHTKYRPYKCTYENCPISCTANANLKAHIRTHTSDRPYKCDAKNCEKSFKLLVNLQNHQRTHSKLKPYTCSICMKSFTEYSTLYKHNNRIHKKGFVGTA